MRQQGTITTWKDDQGFGFIAPSRGGPEVFVHIKSFPRLKRRPVGSDRVTYRLARDAKGRMRAEDVRLAGERALPPASFALGPGLLALATSFLILVGIWTSVGRLPRAFLWLYLGASAAAFLAYAFDKSAARSGRWRTAESTLHLLGLIGGWPGALVAQRWLRHKSRKGSFQVVFWLTVALNGGALGWALSPAGAAALRSALGAAWT